MSPAASMLPPFSRSGPQLEWVASRYADVEEVLADIRLGVPEAIPDGPSGSIGWLRGSVSRFVNGEEHLRRRALAVEELRHLDPQTLYEIARRRATDVVRAAGKSGDRINVMEQLARAVPVEAIAELLGVPAPAKAGAAVIAASVAYVPGADQTAVSLANTATTQLVEMLSPADTDAIVARMSLLIQACDATAGLIGAAVPALAKFVAADQPPTERLLREVLRHSPMLLASRRVARADATIQGSRVRTGDTVLCMVESANRDPEVFEEPDSFDLERDGPKSMTFGSGYRPCPGESQAMSLAAGVIDCVRQFCIVEPGQDIDYEPPPGLRIPRRVEVVLK